MSDKMKVYLDQDEIRLMNNGFGFTGASEPIEKLTMPTEVSEADYVITPSGKYLIFRRKDGRDGNFKSYIRAA